MSVIVVASDNASVRREVISVLDNPDITILEAISGPDVITLAHEEDPDLVICDLQMGAMGAIAVCLELRLQASYDALDSIPFLMLLDRRPDVFQAKRSGADGWLVKPLDAIKIRRAVRALLGGERYEDLSFQPATVLVGEKGG